MSEKIMVHLYFTVLWKNKVNLYELTWKKLKNIDE